MDTIICGKMAYEMSELGLVDTSIANLDKSRPHEQITDDCIHSL